jgi:hypothetical protein
MKKNMFYTIVGFSLLGCLSTSQTDTTDGTGMQTTDAGSGPCEQSEDVCGVASMSPNYLCEDGETMAGPGACERNEDGDCRWTFVRCEEDE